MLILLKNNSATAEQYGIFGNFLQLLSVLLTALSERGGVTDKSTGQLLQIVQRQCALNGR